MIGPAAANRRSGAFGNLLTAGMFHGDRAGEDDRVGNNDLAPFLAGDHGCARLDVLHRAFDAGNTDEIADAEWLLNEQKNACEEILQDILKGESHSDAAN